MKILILALAMVVSTAPPASAQRTDSSHPLAVGGRDRTYTLHLPALRDGRPLPLVVLLHGRLGTGAGMARLTSFDAIADSVGILVAYPDGWRRSWADGRMGTPADRQGVDDVAFVLAMIDDIARTVPIDRHRIYVAGISNGGFMTERLACEAGDRFAGFGVDAATLSDSLAERCRPSPVSMMFFNGTADPLVPWAGGELGSRGHALGVEATLMRWAAWDRCSGTPTEETLPDTAHDGTTASVRRYAPCADGTAIVAYKFTGGGHTWPGGLQYLPPMFVGVASKNLDGSRTLWAFFASRRRQDMLRPGGPDGGPDTLTSDNR